MYFLLILSTALERFMIFGRITYQITKSISAHEQFVVGPWLKTFPQKVIRRAPTYIIYPGGAALLTWGSIKLAADATAAEDYSHRP